MLWVLTVQILACFTADSPVMLSHPPWYCYLCVTCVLSHQVHPRVWRRWYEPGLGGLQSSVAVLPPLLQEPPPQTCSHCTWWSGFAWVTMCPSSSNSECTHHACIPTTRVSPLVPDLCLSTASFKLRNAQERHCGNCSYTP